MIELTSDEKRRCAAWLRAEAERRSEHGHANMDLKPFESIAGILDTSAMLNRDLTPKTYPKTLPLSHDDVDVVILRKQIIGFIAEAQRVCYDNKRLCATIGTLRRALENLAAEFLRRSSESFDYGKTATHEYERWTHSAQSLAWNDATGLIIVILNQFIEQQSTQEPVDV